MDFEVNFSILKATFDFSSNLFRKKNGKKVGFFVIFLKNSDFWRKLTSLSSSLCKSLSENVYFHELY